MTIEKQMDDVLDKCDRVVKAIHDMRAAFSDIIDELKRQSIQPNTRLRCYDCDRVYDKYYESTQAMLIDTEHGNYCDECKAKREACK